MKKKIIIIISILIFGLLAYKIYRLNEYKVEKIKINTKEIFKEKINIKSSTDKKEYETLKLDKLSIKNNFKGYEDAKNNANFKVKYDKDGKVKSFYSLSSFEQYINLLSKNSLELYATGVASSSGDTKKDMKEFLKKKNIKNDVELLNYLKNKYPLKSNIFTSVKTIKNNYLLNSLLQVTMPEFKKVVLINGDLDGYIIVMESNIKEIHLLKDNKQYIIVLSGDELTDDEFVIKLLETVKFS